MKKRVYLLLLMCIGFSTWGYADTYNKTLQLGETLTIPPLRSGGDNTSFYSIFENSNPDVASVSVETAGTVTDKIPQIVDKWGNVTSWYYYTYTKYQFIITGLQSGTTTINIGSKSGSRFYARATYIITVVDVKDIIIPSNLSLSLGENYTFTPTIIDTGAATTLTWTSSNTSVATIDANGVLTTKDIGTTTIICTAHNGVSAQCVVTVNPVLATSISLDKASEEMVTGETMQLAANVSPDNTTNPAVTWSSTNPSVALVDGSGLVTAVGPGTCNITATTADGSNLNASCQIHVLGDVLYADDAVAVPSGTFVLPIQLKNESPVTGLQFELQLPEGITVAEDNAGKLDVSLSERATDQSISASRLSNGNYQFVAFSGTSSALTGNEGAIAYLTLNVNEDMPVGEYAIGIKEVELTKTDGTSLHHKDLTSKLTLTEPIMGDTNGDGKVTVTDAVGIVNHILHRTPSVFITKAADVNNDGDITISDAVKVINIVLEK